MAERVCDACGKKRSTSGGKVCSSGHFICQSCNFGHAHCPLCHHTLR